MCARKLKYAAGDDLLLYATPKEAMQNDRRLEEEKEKKARMRRSEGARIHSEPSSVTKQQLLQQQLQQRQLQQLQQQQQQVQMAQNMHVPRTDYVHGSSQPVNGKLANIPHSRSRPIPQQPGSTGKSQQMYTSGNGSSSSHRIVSSPPIMDPPSSAAQRAQAQVRHTPPRVANESPVVVQNAMISRTKQHARESPKSVTEEDTKDARIAVQLFHNHDVRGKSRLTAEELQNLLQNDDNTHFCISSVDALINLFGASRFGTVNESEFISLYKRVKKWRKVYVDNDINGSYTITMSEFHNSLQELGYMVPVEVSEKLFDQYAEFINPANNAKELKFDKFVEALVWLMRLTKIFRKFDTNQEGVANIHYKDFIDVTLYLGRFLPH